MPPGADLHNSFLHLGANTAHEHGFSYFGVLYYVIFLKCNVITSNTPKVAILLLRKDGVGVCGMSELQKLVLHRQT